MTKPLLDRTSQIRMLDLSVVHEPIRDAIIADVRDLIASNAFTNGPQVTEFETAFAAYCGSTTCVGVACGLDALRLALLAGGLERGDEVIVPAQTFIATFEAVSQAGGRPVVVDVNESDYNIDPEAVSAVVTRRTRFLLPVHLYGQMADMRALEQVAKRHELQIVEDACQAHGAARDRLKAGAVGLAGAFSFYPSKNLGAMGDAGALVTSDEGLADRVRALREHGQVAKHRHEFEGFTARLDTIQALVLLHKLPYLDEWNAQRRAAASYYTEALEGAGDLVLPPTPSGSAPVWHVYPVRTADPEALAAFLSERGISTGRHYPEPPHLSQAYRALGHRPGAFPVAETLAEELLSLPIFPGILEQQLETVVDAVSDFFH